MYIKGKLQELSNGIREIRVDIQDIRSHMRQLNSHMDGFLADVRRRTSQATSVDSYLEEVE